MTGSDGRASVTYTAPPAPPAGSTVGVCSGSIVGAPLAGRCVQVVATPISTDYSTASSRAVQIHLIQSGVIVPGATHLFEESGALERVAEATIAWTLPGFMPRESNQRPVPAMRPPRKKWL